MSENDTKRVSRLTAILTQLQSKRILTATTLAYKFGVSTRTIYRDIKALERAGIPIITEEGKGYSMMADYRIPPIMFSETEAKALMTAELLVLASKDQSLINEFQSAIQKIKAVLPDRIKQGIENLEGRIAVSKFYTDSAKKSQNLLNIQKALSENMVIEIKYTNASNTTSTRKIEPFAIYSNANDEWVLIAFCQTREDFRSFSLIRIQNIGYTGEKYPDHQMTFEQYLKKTYGNK